MRPKNRQGKPSPASQQSHPPEIALQLSDSLLRKAEEMAISEGVSLADFILYAVAEKIARSEPSEKPGKPKQ